ncbi:hypothetical protein B0T10DRAFT_13768 [Thelonectria olida]|uniref:Uncharacterized protein n=1 Tax=Thelonectria olida TaxID=1576542 RepID=A0A9P8WIA0_9HYPO|nr:hypothetical protein B0T10DRAFT_13768 [Thelonectria olida]
MPGTDRDPSPPATAEPSELLHQDDNVPEETTSLSAPLPPFEPIFTLLTNTTTNTTVHPQIHYIFSDDDPSILAAAAAADPASHRSLVVDLEPAAEGSANRWAVSWASSLSRDFAVTGSNVALQQNEGGDDAGDDDRRGGGSLMLRVKGVEREPMELRSDSLPSSGSGSLGREDVEGLTDDFRRRMAVLKKVVDEGEKRRNIVEQQQKQEQEQEQTEEEDVAVEGYNENEKEQEKEGEEEEKGEQELKEEKGKEKAKADD